MGDRSPRQAALNREEDYITCQYTNWLCHRISLPQKVAIDLQYIGVSFEKLRGVYQKGIFGRNPFPGKFCYIRLGALIYKATVAT